MFGVLIALGLANIFLWAIWVAPYVRNHGRKNAFFLFNWASVRDYGTAARISKETGCSPWFVRAYGILSALALVVLLVWFLLSVVSI